MELVFGNFLVKISESLMNKDHMILLDLLQVLHHDHKYFPLSNKGTLLLGTEGVSRGECFGCFPSERNYQGTFHYFRVCSMHRVKNHFVDYSSLMAVKPK